MVCCKKEEEKVMQMEDMKASAANFGFDAQWIADVIQKWGNDVLALVVEAARNGFSKDLIIEVLQKFGPLLLELMVDIINKFSMRKAAVGEVVVGEEVSLFDASILEVVVQKYLPMIMEKYGEKIIQMLIDWLLNNVLKK